MFAYPLRAAALAAAAIGLSGCAYNGLYSGVSVGYGNAGYYDPYYDGYGYGYPGYGYSRLGYGYSPYWGWNDGFYYPGTGIYVYDSYRRPFRWSDAQRRYWSIRRQQALSSTTSRDQVIIRDNWGDFDRAKVRTQRIERSNRPARIERRVERAEQKASIRQQRRMEIRSSSDSSERGDRSNGRRNGHTREE